VDNRDVQSEAWNQGEDVRLVIDRLDQKIESANLTPSMVWEPTVMFTNLRESLALANRSLRGQLPRRLRGPLLERLNDEWALTDEGLESLTSDAFASIDLFPDTLPHLQTPGTPPFAPPFAPLGVDPAVWAQLVEIARVTYMVHGRRSLRRRGFR
jgi:hypothetical protein